MSRRPLSLGLLPLVLLSTACGGSSHKSSASVPSATVPTQTQTASSSTATSSTMAPSTSSSPTSTTSTTSTAATSTSATSTGTTTGADSGGAPITGGVTGSSGGGGSVHIRVPATFVIRGGGPLSPNSISAPAFLAVEVTVLSRDGHGHQVVIGTPVPHRLFVPAGGHAGILLAGQRAGQYSIVVDGHTRARLLIGGEPGP